MGCQLCEVESAVESGEDFFASDNLGKNIFCTIENASGPESLTMAMAPTPGAVDKAQIVSSLIVRGNIIWGDLLQKVLESSLNTMVVSHIDFFPRIPLW